MRIINAISNFNQRWFTWIQKLKIGKLKDNVLFRLPCEIYCLTFCHLFTEIILTFGTRSFYLLRRVIRQFSCLLMPEVILKKNLLDSLQILWQSKLLNIMELLRLNISAKTLMARYLWFFFGLFWYNTRDKELIKSKKIIIENTILYDNVNVSYASSTNNACL